MHWATLIIPIITTGLLMVMCWHLAVNLIQIKAKSAPLKNYSKHFVFGHVHTYVHEKPPEIFNQLPSEHRFKKKLVQIEIHAQPRTFRSQSSNFGDNMCALILFDNFDNIIVLTCCLTAVKLNCYLLLFLSYNIYLLSKNN